MYKVNCINGLIEAKVANALAKNPPSNFDEWIMRVMGEGIANIFMRPYNFKVCHVMLCYFTTYSFILIGLGSSYDTYAVYMAR